MPGFHLLFPQGGLTALQARRPAVPIEALDFVVAGTGPEEAAVRTGREALAPCLETARKTGSWQSVLDHGLRAIEALLRSEHLPLEAVVRDEEGLAMVFTLGGDPFATYLRVSRRLEDEETAGTVPALLARACREWAAEPLSLRMDLIIDGEGTVRACHGEGAFRMALRADQARWKRHLLGGVAAREWLARAGHLATLQIRAVEGGWPYAVVDGGPLRLVKRHRWSTDDPPVDPGALCRSVTTDDECWIFTCECSDRYCGGIHSGILVAHDQGLVVWRSPEFPEVPLAVFGQQPYREAALAAMAALLRNPPRSGGLDWTTGTSPEWLRKALEDALAGRHWW